MESTGLKDGDVRAGRRSRPGRLCIAAILVAEMLQGLTPDTGSVASSRLLRMACAVFFGEDQAAPDRPLTLATACDEGAERSRNTAPPAGEDESEEPDEVCLAAFARKAAESLPPFLDPGHLSPAIFDPSRSPHRPHVRRGMRMRRGSGPAGPWMPDSIRLTC